MTAVVSAGDSGDKGSCQYGNVILTFWRRIFFQILAHLYLKCE